MTDRRDGCISRIDETWGVVDDCSLVTELLARPLQWRRPRRVLVNAVCDLFHDDISNEDIAVVFGVMAASPQHTYRVLTKRAERMCNWFRWLADPHYYYSSEIACACVHQAQMRMRPLDSVSDRLLQSMITRWRAGWQKPNGAWHDSEAPWPLLNVRMETTISNKPCGNDTDESEKAGGPGE